MLTKNEITSLNLSPTKKDFVQIWNELLEVSSKLSERWDPTSTNESDPGIVILKALAGIADKLNYNIDKNTLEAFMPTAAQEDSMRKLCEMLGYNIKYYQSATTNVTIKYHNPDPSEDEAELMVEGVEVPKFTVITNGDKDISYFTTNQTPYKISADASSITFPCMEGQIVKCESISDNNVITIGQISESNRFYLPETQIAENGIFIYNIATDLNNSLVDGTAWEKVDNLNIQVRGSRVFKFGFDSYEGRPYVEFPNDYSELFNDGIFIYYARTNGVNGNISARTLTQLELPSNWSNISAESFIVENTFSATSGSNIETIEQAYNNFKKTIGTFETLVTCRDYMNKIYSMVQESNGKPYVSNVLVTDIRNDVNRAVTICSCDDNGIFYKEVPLTTGSVKGELYKGAPILKAEYNSEYQVGDTKYSDYVQVGEPEYSGWVNVEDEETGTKDWVFVKNINETNTELSETGWVNVEDDETGYSDWRITKDEDTGWVTKKDELTDWVNVEDEETGYSEWRTTKDEDTGWVTTTNETGFVEVNRTVSDFTKVSEDETGFVVVDEQETGFVKVGDTEYGDYIQVGDAEYSEYELEGTPEYSDYIQVGDAKHSESTTVEFSEPEQLSKDEQVTFVASEANMPRIATEVQISSYYDYDNAQGPIMGTRYTCWYLGSENSSYKMYLYADGFGSDWIPADSVNPDIFFPASSAEYFKSAPAIASYDENSAPVFAEIDLGTVSAYKSDGSRSDFWLITQGDRVFETLLPIEWIPSTNTIIVNQQIKTVTNNITETIEKQRTETVKKQRTKTVKEQRYALVKEQNTKTVKAQNTKTIKEQRDIELEKQNTVTVEKERTINLEKERDFVIKEQQTHTVEKERTANLEKERDLVVKLENTKTITNTSVTDIEKERDIVIKQQNTETIKKQRTGTVEMKRDVIKETTVTNEQRIVEDHAINHFDIVFYPFKQYNQIKSTVLNDKDIRSIYDSSFTYTSDNLVGIKNELEAETTQTIAHNILSPRESNGVLGEGRLGDLVSINNYLKLNATVATSSKVTDEDGDIIVNKIKVALANAFNMRELDFGEEIPFDSLVKVIENADSRIRVVSLNEPDLYTTFSVLTGKDNKGVKVTEYAVASGWLNDEAASATGRFVDLEGNDTFNTKEAKEIYNKLVIRNLLAGRVSLFKYNDTFTTSFAECAYQVTKTVTNKPEGLPVPTFDSPYTIWADGAKIYVGHLEKLLEKPDALATAATADKQTTSVVDETEQVTYISKWDDIELKAVFAKISYSEIYTPDDYKDNIITADKAGRAITDISASCKVLATVDEITDVKLTDGELIKFRAPNFTTKKTYPAYVNYHLQRNRALLSEAVPAKATSLFDILDSDRAEWDTDNQNIKWQKILDYFSSVDSAAGVDPKDPNAHKKVLTVEQTISAYKPAASTNEDTCTNESGHVKGPDGTCVYCGKTLLDGVQVGPIKVAVKNSTNENRSFEEIFAEAGCIKLVNNDFKAKLTWAPEDGEKAPAGDVPINDLELGLDNPFITNSTVISNLKEAVETAITERVGMVNTDGSPVLPTACAWKVTFEFEYVPFEAATLSKWEDFVRACVENFDNNYRYQVFDFKPTEDSATILWRIFGEGYDIGKYVTTDTEKLLKFDAKYFGLLPEVHLKGIYIAEDIGMDANPATIKNDEEYRLRANEYLYIEYTPSSTSEDGTAEKLAAVTEILGEGTIIRPSGFDNDLIDSTILGREVTPYKEVTFITENSTSSKIAMQRLGANEQIEVRDFAKVELTKDSFKTLGSSVIYIYKNFNNCPELEVFNTDSDGQRIKNSYTLKDGEYIFYTDQNKSEFAYFANGTQVTLEGTLVLQQCDILEIADIFDMSVADIPWKYVSFANNDKIAFQEFQYITLGSGDTLRNLRLASVFNEEESYLSDKWQYCSDVLYSVAGDPDTIEHLPTINIYNGNNGNGWEVCSTFELDVSPNYAQTLRNDGKVQTKLTLSAGSVSPGGVNDTEAYQNRLIIEPSDNNLSFKTNLACSTVGNHINIDDVYYNPDKLKGFQLKIFQEETPAIVETAPGKVVPYRSVGASSIVNWSGEPLPQKSQLELWHQVNLDKLKPTIDKNSQIITHDNALRLVANIIPKTYGIFCIYLSYTNNEAASTWIEVLPGTDRADITLFNVEDNENVWAPIDTDDKAHKLLLRPGINCIRINKTGRIFIKTSAISQGTLYFDELRLVSCEPIEYTDANNIKHTMTTQGLNLEQLGYLNTADTANGISRAMRNKINTISVEEAHARLKDKAAETKQTFNNLCNDLQEIKGKLQTLESFANNAKAEFKTFSDRYVKDADIKSTNATIRKLFNKYYEISTALSQEKALLDALDNQDNKTISELEQQLVSLINDFSSIDTVKQQLLADLDTLKAKTLDSLNDLSEAAILKDFYRAKENNSIDVTELLEDIVLAHKTSVMNAYNAELTSLAKEAEKILSTGDHRSLLTILDSKREDSENLRRVQLLADVAQLISALDRTTIDTQLDTAYNFAASGANKELVNALSQLRELLINSEIKTYVTKIETAAADSNDKYLNSLVDSLVTILDKTYGSTAIGTPSSEKYDQTIKRIDTLIATAKSNINSSSVVDGLVTGVNDIRTSLSSSYNKQIKTLSEAIKEYLEDLIAEKDDKGNTTVSAAISKLKASENAHISYILTKLTRLTDQRDNELDPTGDYNDDAIVAVWSQWLREQLSDHIEDFYTTFYKAINDTTSVPIGTINTLESLSTSFCSGLFANYFNDFKDLASHVNTLVRQNSAGEKSIKLITDIGKELLSISPEVANAMTIMKANTSGRKTVIANLITRLTALDTATTKSPSVTEKQQLISELKKELEKAKQVDEQLFNVVASLLIPSISFYDSHDDVFYDKLTVLIEGKKTDKENLIGLKELLLVPDADYVSSIDNILLVLESLFGEGSTLMSQDIALLKCLNNEDQLNDEELDKELHNWFANINLEDFIAKSYLPTDYLDKITDLKTSAMLQKEITTFEKKDLFKKDFFFTVDYSEKSAHDLVADQLAEIKLLDDTDILTELLTKIDETESEDFVATDEFKDAYIVEKTEKQLLEDIRKVDVHREFYYNAPIEPSLAIEFNKSKAELNTLMNPLMNYDINNVNNSFVISKLDIDYLTTGIQIASSSKIR